MNIEGKKVVFYDGECGFCNRTIAYVLKKDKTNSILFASIQSEFTKNLFIEKKWTAPDLSTFYFFDNGQLFKKSKAALKVAKYLTFPYSLLQVFWIAPQFIRDRVYNIVARNRKKISNGYCFVPTSIEKELFID